MVLWRLARTEHDHGAMPWIALVVPNRFLSYVQQHVTVLLDIVIRTVGDLVVKRDRHVIATRTHTRFIAPKQDCVLDVVDHAPGRMRPDSNVPPCR
jgi:hypothetical protein